MGERGYLHAINHSSAASHRSMPRTRHNRRHLRQSVPYRLVRPAGPPGAGMGPTCAGQGAHWGSPAPDWQWPGTGTSLYTQPAGNSSTTSAIADGNGALIMHLHLRLETSCAKLLGTAIATGTYLKLSLFLSKTVADCQNCRKALKL